MIKHVHGEAVAERVRRHADAEADAGACGIIHRPGQPVAHRTVGDGPDGEGTTLTGHRVGFILLPGACKKPAHLIDVGRIGERHHAIGAGALPGTPAAGPALLGGADHHVRNSIVQTEVPAAQGEDLVQPAARRPEGID